LPPVNLLATSAGDILDYALAAFFIASGAGLLYLFVRMGGTFGRLSSFVKGAERDALPVVVKAGGTVDRVNDQLDKLDTVTDSAVSMADAVRVAKDAAARRESELDDELRNAAQAKPESPPPAA
jgi:hypothetical protein